MKVLLTGELRGSRGTAAVCRIHDLSRNGACLDADRVYAVGEAVTFMRGNLVVQGTVAWSRGRKFGVTFETPIRATELLVQMSQSRQAQPEAEAEPAPAAPRPLTAASGPFPSR